MQESNLIAVRVQRRSIAAAVFIGTQLDYTEVRELLADADKAATSAGAFVAWLLATFDPGTAVLEVVVGNGEWRRGALSEVIRRSFRGAGVPVTEIGKEELYRAYGYPALKSRRELRQVASVIWPILSEGNGKDGVLEAAALGLFAGTEMLYGS